MKNKLLKKINNWFDHFATRVSKFAGSSAAFSIALCIIILWLAFGPIFKFSDTWQLVINTGTTIITFLMVFLIQRSQNKDNLSLQLKLNELVASSGSTSNRLIDIEDLTQDELETLHKYYAKLAKVAKKESNLKETHSIAEIDGKDSKPKGKTQK
ncbi:MAG: low affinity iron permease family protein [Ignavibacteriaceae bacterium]